jgi:hypothetical protein
LGIVDRLETLTPSRDASASQGSAIWGWIDKPFLRPAYATLIKDELEFRNIDFNFIASQFIYCLLYAHIEFLARASSRIDALKVSAIDKFRALARSILALMRRSIAANGERLSTD